MCHENVLFLTSKNKQVQILKSFKSEILKNPWKLRTALLAKSINFSIINVTEILHYPERSVRSNFSEIELLGNNTSVYFLLGICFNVLNVLFFLSQK